MERQEKIQAVLHNVSSRLKVLESSLLKQLSKQAAQLAAAAAAVEDGEAAGGPAAPVEPTGVEAEVVTVTSAVADGEGEDVDAT